MAAAFLVECGFTILHRNLRLGPLEIDIVARADDLVALVEVRDRSASGVVGPFESVGPGKRRAMLAAAERFARERLVRPGIDAPDAPARLAGVERLRIDVVTVEWGPAGPVVRHAPAALSG